MVQLMIEKNAITQTPINELLASRWSGRSYDSTRDIDDKKIIALLEAARWAPSCYGDQPWRFIICNRATNNQAWEDAFSCLAEGNQSWAKDAPLLILASAGSVMTRNGNPNRWGQYDTGAASMSLCLQATSMGMMVHQMGGFNEEKARKIFLVPEQYTPMAMMAVGYQLPLERIPDESKERELAERSRRPLSEIIFDGAWGDAIKS
jgi:nitroreductase